MNAILNPKEINAHAGTQSRASLNDSTVTEYAEAMKAGALFPPVTVFHDGSEYFLADGFHRLIASIRAGMTEISADVRPGGRLEALEESLGSNAAHGLRRTNADKRHAVELALEHWPNRSDRAIAEMCGVSNNFVSVVRPQVSSDDTSPEPTVTREGKDGKQYPAPARPEPIPEPANDEPETEPREPAPEATRRQPRNGNNLVTQAICIMAKIAKDDFDRPVAWKRMRGWLDENE